MSSPNRVKENAFLLAVTAALAVLAQQIAGKIIRDTLFLSLFSQRSLAQITIVAAVVAIAAVPPFAHVLTKHGPGRAVPAGFLTSALLYVVEWALFQRSPRPAVILIYLHFAATGAALVSGFWSAINERFDPRTARRSIGIIVGAAAIGGALGGTIGGVTADVPASALLLGLAAMQVACAWLVWSLARGSAPVRLARASSEFRSGPKGFAAIAHSSYLRDLALLAFSVTACQAILEYVFRVKAQDAFPQKADLQRMIALGHTVTSVGVFGLQALFSRRALERLGVGGSVLSLPVTAAAGAGVAMAFPTLGIACGAWVTEGVVHSSLFRSGYELLYAPMPPAEKRSAKGVIDVGFARLGDMMAGMVAWIAQMTMVSRYIQPLLGGAVAFAALSWWAGRRLQRGHVRALERSLVEQAAENEIAVGEDAMTRTTVFDTMQFRRELGVAAVAAAGAGSEPEIPLPAGAALASPLSPRDRAAALRSRDPVAARAALQSEEPLDAELVSLAIPLLGDSELASHALLALRKVSGRFIGQLSDALCNPDLDDTIRRRLPRVMSAEPDARAVEGLFCGLTDRRFEVRYQCGLALSRIRAKAPDVTISEERVLAAVAREIESDRGIWESRKALDREISPTAALDRALRERFNQSLEHVFTLLALVLPRSSLHLAYQGLNVSDPMLKGTALEYLDAVLPPALRDTLWPYLSDEPPRRGPRRSKEEIGADLSRLNESVVIRIDEIRALERG